MSSPKEYAVRFAEALRESGLSQSQLAKRLSLVTGRDIKPQTIQYLCSKAKESALTSEAAAELRVSYEWLARGTGPKRPLYMSQSQTMGGDISPEAKPYPPIMAPESELSERLSARIRTSRLSSQDLVLLDTIVTRLIA